MNITIKYEIEINPGSIFQAKFIEKTFEGLFKEVNLFLKNKNNKNKLRFKQFIGIHEFDDNKKPVIVYIPCNYDILNPKYIDPTT
jgi:hypothetical protein